MGAPRLALSSARSQAQKPREGGRASGCRRRGGGSAVAREGQRGPESARRPPHARGADRQDALLKGVQLWLTLEKRLNFSVQACQDLWAWIRDWFNIEREQVPAPEVG